MIIIKGSLKKYFSMVRRSYFGMQLLLLFMSILISNLIVNKGADIIVYKNYSDLINAMGVMSSFFILAVDKINISKLNKTLRTPAEVRTFSKKKKEEIPLSTKIINTVVIILINTFLILGLSYASLLFWNGSFLSLNILVALNLNILFGFLFIISIWHFIELQ